MQGRYWVILCGCDFRSQMMEKTTFGTVINAWMMTWKNDVPSSSGPPTGSLCCVFEIRRSLTFRFIALPQWF